jgi:hydrogenase maturation factor
VNGVPACEGDHCITCSDEGVAMRTLELDAEGQWVCLDAGGNRQVVMTDLVEPVDAGTVVLVHAGVALTRLAPEEAA